MTEAKHPERQGPTFREVAVQEARRLARIFGGLDGEPLDASARVTAEGMEKAEARSRVLKLAALYGEDILPPSLKAAVQGWKGAALFDRVVR